MHIYIYIKTPRYAGGKKPEEKNIYCVSPLYVQENDKYSLIYKESQVNVRSYHVKMYVMIKRTEVRGGQEARGETRVLCCKKLNYHC